MVRAEREGWHNPSDDDEALLRLASAKRRPPAGRLAWNRLTTPFRRVRKSMEERRQGDFPGR